MKEKVLITPRSFGKDAPELFAMLEDAGYEIVRNDTGSILEKEQMQHLIADCVGVILGVDPMPADVLSAAPNLRAIAKYGVGVDNIDMAYCTANHIKVSRTLGANSEAVADYTMALMLGVARKIVLIDAQCRRLNWSKISSIDVSNATLGVFGLGAIGKLVCKRAQGFGMRIIAYDPYWPEVFACDNHIEQSDSETILRNADFISLHLPLTPETKNIIGAKELQMMKKNAVLINTSRGGLIDEDALLEALKQNLIYGAGLDAFSHEPPENPEWFELDNVVFGSHCAASTLGATGNMGHMAAQNLLHDLK